MFSSPVSRLVAADGPTGLADADEPRVTEITASHLRCRNLSAAWKGAGMCWDDSQIIKTTCCWGTEKSNSKSAAQQDDVNHHVQP